MVEVADERKDLESSPGVFIYNPALLPRQELKRLFLLRHAELEQVLHHLAAKRAPAHHVLVIGERGMGKTTLLIRLAHAIEEDPTLRQSWLPVRFDEEQYNLGGLIDLWLNCLEKITEDSGDPEPHRMADRLSEKFRGPELEEAAFFRLKEYSIRKDRRLLLLIDNFDLVLSRLGPERESHRLRDLLVNEEWLTLVGASPDPIQATADYENPFYELFQVVSLEPLTREETLELLRGMASYYDRRQVLPNLIKERRDVLEVLHILTGGNLRTATILFSVLKEHPAADLGTLLDHLFDQHTSRYKERVESLPPQGQRVFDAVARAWDPTTAEKVAGELRIERGVASGQLHRLADRNFVGKVRLPQRSMGFQIRDRFFNLWYLMRGGRRQRRLLHSLIGFIDLLYRQGRSPPGGFEALVEKLRPMDLVTRETIELARVEARRIMDGGSREQLDLFAPKAGVPPKVRLLALCRNGYGAEAVTSARDLRKYDHETILPHLILAYLLERQGSVQEALKTIEEELASHPQPWLQLERARLRSALGDDVDDIRDDLAPLSQCDSLPPAKLAAAVAELSRGGRADFRSMLLRLLRRMKAPGELTVVLAEHEIELSLGHREKALESFRQAVALSSRDSSGESRGALFEATLELAARILGQETSVRESLADETLEILKEDGLAEEWLPLSHVLASLGGKSDRPRKLSPEMQALTEIVLGRLRKIEAQIHE